MITVNSILLYFSLLILYKLFLNSRLAILAALFTCVFIVGPLGRPSPTQQLLPLLLFVYYHIYKSYFEKSKADGEPNYTLSFDLYENGVSGALKINYGNYSLNGVMSKFEALPQKPCEK